MKTESPDQTIFSDEELVALCRKQLPYQTYAFEELLKRHEETVFRICLHYLGSPEDAEEVCQDVFMRVFHHITTFAGRSAFRTWLIRMTYNSCKSRQIKNLRRNRLNRQFLSEGNSDQKKVDSGLATEALQRLSDQDRRIISMRYVAELKLMEISDMLEIGISATKMRLQRAVQKFKRSYDHLARKKGH